MNQAYTVIIYRILREEKDLFVISDLCNVYLFLVLTRVRTGMVAKSNAFRA